MIKLFCFLRNNLKVFYKNLLLIALTGLLSEIIFRYEIFLTELYIFKLIVSF